MLQTTIRYKEKYIPRKLVCSEETRAVLLTMLEMVTASQYLDPYFVCSGFSLPAMYADSNNDVVELNPSNFRKEVIVIRDDSVWIIEFYVSW